MSTPLPISHSNSNLGTFGLLNDTKNTPDLKEKEKPSGLCLTPHNPTERTPACPVNASTTSHWKGNKS